MLRFLSLLVLGGFITGAVNAQELLGFDEAGAAAQLELEADFDSRLSAADQEQEFCPVILTMWVRPRAGR